MKTEELIGHARRLAKGLASERAPRDISMGRYAQACEFLRSFAGAKSSFFESARAADQFLEEDRAKVTAAILESFADYVASGLFQEISPERQAQLDVVSDLLDQSHSLLENRKAHPAAPAVLIGATLEEFLRTWVETEGISIGNRKPGLDTYAKCLREADLISKQDTKDLTAWAGIRNHAAHGQWTEVQDKDKISLMLQGVNLYMRKYEKGTV